MPAVRRRIAGKVAAEIGRSEPIAEPYPQHAAFPGDRQNDARALGALGNDEIQQRSAGAIFATARPVSAETLT